jgi:alpha-mannosidase
MNNLSENSARAQSIMYSLNRASLELNEFNEEEAIRARNIIAVELNKKGGDPSLRLSAVGHAHIDLAWLWPIRETKRKAARTLSTALMMLERYPDYVFGASQPQLYSWVKESYPALYKKITARIAEGRWEAQGGMWVEADTNISGGEALVRQILYGKRFFQKEFQKDMKSLWLPDVFGYSGALPQILKKSGIDYFMTIKLSWSVHNKFPHHTFVWTGIDGSEILAHMPPEGTYNSAASPSSIRKAENEYLDKGIAQDCLMLFGIGDGGGGPGEEHLERLTREKNLEGLVPVTQETSIQFFDRLKSNQVDYKTWQGELYLEKHQGTLTSQAKSKRYNRKLEIALRELEFIAVLAKLQGGYEYPSAQIEALWKEILLYQFHDILPGSSIRRVYEESIERYGVITQEVKKLTLQAYEVLTQNNSIVFNSLSWNREEWLKLEENWIKVAVPSMGYAAFGKQTLLNWISSSNYPSADINKLENEYLLLKFNSDGSIKSIYDKELDREVISPGQVGNQLKVYHDQGDAWDFSIQYNQRPSMEFKLTSTQASVDGAKAEVLQIYTYGNSQLEQRIVLMSNSRRVDFITKVLWQESQKMLRTSFPINVLALEATCDIQFGCVNRPTHINTGFDMAKQEVCAHKWVDISEPEYGVALLNDCKYGYNVDKNVIDLNLLRSPRYPDETADQGEQEFTYSIYPHRGNHMAGKVNQVAYELNMPLVVRQSGSENNQVNKSMAFLHLDRENVIIETIKKAEDSEEIIVRLYECYGTSCSAKLIMGINPIAVKLVDLMEKEVDEIEILKMKQKDASIELHFKPFEILTLKIQL